VQADNGTALRIVQSGQVQLPLEQRVDVTVNGKIFIFDEHEQLIAEEEGVTSDQLISVD
jgi:sn-glycerol 3-phosphate transport system ATP-binding protein